VVTHQLQVERGTGKVRRPETDVLPLCQATNQEMTIANSGKKDWANLQRKFNSYIKLQPSLYPFELYVDRLHQYGIIFCAAFSAPPEKIYPQGFLAIFPKLPTISK